MTIPRNRTLSCKKGFQAQADVSINSPNQANSQNVNVIVSPLTKDQSFDVITDKTNFEYKGLDEVETKTENLDNKPLTDNVEKPILTERSIETAKKTLEEMEQIVKDKDNLIEALSLILDIFENNPLTINKLIIAKEDELTRLLFLLTGADQIHLIKSDPEIKCCGNNKNNVTHIQKIMIEKGGQKYNFKYSFPNVVELLENRNICWKLVV